MTRRKIKGWIACIFTLTFLLTGCGSGDKKSQEQNSETARQDSIENAVSAGTEIEQWFQNPELEKWKTRMEKNYQRFSASRFKNKQTDSLDTDHPQKFTEEKWRTFRPYFILSPDRSRAIDLYSYGLIPPDSGKAWEGGEPDSEVNLVSLSERTKTRLLFAGPGTAFQLAEWLNDSIIIVTGESDANLKNKTLPVLWRINLNAGVITEYRYQDSLP